MIEQVLSTVGGRPARSWVVALALAIPAIAGAGDEKHQDATLVDSPVRAEGS